MVGNRGTYEEKLSTDRRRICDFRLGSGSEDSKNGPPPGVPLYQDTGQGRFCSDSTTAHVAPGRTSNEADDHRRRTHSASLRGHGSLHQARCIEARDRIGRGARYGFTRDRSTRKTRGSFRSSAEHGALSGALHDLAHEGVVGGGDDVIRDFQRGFEPWIPPGRGPQYHHTSTADYPHCFSRG
ncbi:uncharacterized protein TM35_000232340 [Trypanosoma theileri]|uniref:Uncharacterized protein n=1 Tax=Trypanosoma theileri TaxID=67003 RepID=A0A1X0NS14_9TRYP|nr:uncharacterized protein TM35_000232340 [Trypanosoma theileri]ORC87263.1 hypothetical protein TM35_000232340 [Trypanosoma theileri]